MLEIAIAVAVGLVSGAVVALKVIAPKTANTVDDKVLERLEALEKLVDVLKAQN